jgi:hypothetical protein
MNFIIHCLLMLSIGGSMVLARDLDATAMAKLSPDLQALLADQEPRYAQLTENRFSRIRSVVGPERETLYPVTIRTTDVEAVKAAGIQTNSDYEGWSTARVSYDQLIQLADLEGVSAVFQGDIYYPATDLAVAESGADLVHDGYLNNIAYDGSGAIVLIIDTGIDWTHLDFRDASDPTQSRILYIWDQTLTATGLEGTPEDRDGTNFSGLNYGVEYTQADINDELDGSAASFVRTADTHSHGTLVASAAAGNGASLSNNKYKGMAPNADLVIVRAGVDSFSDSNLKNALTYAQKIATTTGKAVVANLSLGSHNNAHDGTSTLDDAVDAFVASGNGRVAVVAAGNEGNDEIHVQGTVSASATETISFTVPAYTANSGANNDYFSFELWWGSNADIKAFVTSPNGQKYQRTADQESSQGTTDGEIILYNKTDPDHDNSNRRIFFRVQDVNADSVPAPGTWTLALTNNAGTAQTYHGWLYTSTMGASVAGGDSTYTIASPGTATSAITVGGHTVRWRWYSSSGGTYSFTGDDKSDDIAYFSSIGPTRDERQKPDLSAAGRGVFAATSTDYTPITAFEIVADKYHLTQGTSIASPIVTGAVALLLDYNANLTAAQIKSLLTGNATADSYTGGVPNAEWGYGKLNIFESLAKAISASATVDHDIYVYDTWTSNLSVGLGSGLKMSTRFSPSKSGDVTGALFHVGSDAGVSGNISFEVWSNSGGTPDSKLGNTVTMAVSDIGLYSWNYVNLKASGVSVTSGSDYHLVCLNTGSGTLRLMADDGSVDGRSYYNAGSSWSAYYDWRMRPVVSTNEETLDSSLPVELAFFNAATYRGQILLKWATESEFENQGFRIERKSENETEWSLLGDHRSHSELMGQGSKTGRTDYAFLDKNARKDIKYSYRLSDIPYSPTYKARGVILEDVTLRIEDFVLYPNYPNPFNPATRLAYELPEVVDVQIRISDMRGREVVSWTEAAQSPGYYEKIWAAQDGQGNPVGAGVYFVTMQVGDQRHSQKILLLK